MRASGFETVQELRRRSGVVASDPAASRRGARGAKLDREHRAQRHGAGDGARAGEDAGEPGGLPELPQRPLCAGERRASFQACVTGGGFKSVRR